MMSTKAQIENYLENGGTKCLYCESEDLEPGGRDYDEPYTLTQYVLCLTCGRSWYDVYTLTGIQEVEP